MIDLEAWRTLLYPLGFIATLGFTLRFMVQWLSSEKRKMSYVPRSFWVISLCASFSMMVHSFIQIQFPICLIQAMNNVIAWRNLNLMKANPKSFKFTIVIFSSVFVSITLLFLFQSLVLTHNFDWIQTPRSPWNDQNTQPVGMFWHCLGIIGLVAFGSRFWLQWWFAERKQNSFISESFWWTSLAGALISLCYFIRLFDIVNVLGYGFGLIPYLRNLMLIKKKSAKGLNLQKSKIFLFAGEQSGDLHGKNLLDALKQQLPDHSFYGVGGPEMRKNGLDAIIPMEAFQVMGFTDVFKALPKLYQQFRIIKKNLIKNPPEAIILIDYPGFNLRLAKALRKAGYSGKLIHYISPTVWAWKKGRINHLAKTLDLLITIYPFEQKYFAHTPLQTCFVGHPLVTTVNSYTYRQDINIPQAADYLAIFPGSRPHEIKANLPLQLETAREFLKTNPHFHIIISQAREDLAPLIQHVLTSFNDLSPTLVQGSSYEIMQKATLAIATSGTVTLELALHKVPTIVTYALTPLNYFIGSYIFRIRLPFYCIVNIICSKKVFPEFVHKNFLKEDLIASLNNLYEYRNDCRQECQSIKDLLTQKDASLYAANEITSLIS